jgi:MFS family permease
VSESEPPERQGLAAYRDVLRVREVRTALILGFLLRVPMFGGSVVLTLHVVTTLGHSYGAAGLVTAAATVAAAISGPWRGRLLDRFGLRRVVAPSVIITAACWAVAPFAGYWALLILGAFAGLFVVPTFSIVRQAVIVAVPDTGRRTALALDSVFVELSFMVGPVLGVALATQLSTSWVLFGMEMFAALIGLLLWVVDPRITTAGSRTSGPAGTEVAGPMDAAAEAAGAPAATGDVDEAAPGRRSWFTGRLALVLVAAAAATIVLSGADLATVAGLRAFGQQDWIGPVLALWGLGSIVGGLVYGGLHRPISPFLLLGGLGLLTLPIAFATGGVMLTVLLLISGLFCAPTITATVDQLSRLVPEAARGEAMGWHGSSMTVGSAVGAPLAGLAIDQFGFGGGFGLVAVIGVLVAAAGLLVARVGSGESRSADPRAALAG